MSHCRACSEATLHYLWQEPAGSHWFRCLSCGSDSSSNCYNDTAHIYTAEYLDTHHGNLTHEQEAEQLTTNVNWFEDYKVDTPGRDFLDVGCARGVAMTMMQDKGWGVHGFDVIEAARRPGCTTIAQTFTAGLFPQKYHAVMCREVVEHVDTPLQFLTELANVTIKGGFLQLQTPRPNEKINPIGYQTQHICLLSPLYVRYWLERLGFDIKDYRIWEQGQCWMAKRL